MTTPKSTRQGPAQNQKEPAQPQAAATQASSAAPTPPEQATSAPERLPEAELEVMLCLWQNEAPVRTSALLAQMRGEGLSWTLSTLKVLLGRLAEKKYVCVSYEGRFMLYSPLVRESDYRRRETRSLLRRYYRNSAREMVAALVRDDALTGAELAELAALLERGGAGDA